MSDDPYVYPLTGVLQNKLNIQDQTVLDRVERRFVARRIASGVPKGDFDLSHLRAIHRHLFQDVYVWAGEIRTTSLSKAGSRFLPHAYIERGFAHIHRRIVDSDYLTGLNRANFSGDASRIMSDVNHAHPFREGNGRTQLLYLRQLTERAGHKIDLTRLDAARWNEASALANRHDNGLLQQCIYEAVEQGADQHG